MYIYIYIYIYILEFCSLRSQNYSKATAAKQPPQDSQIKIILLDKPTVHVRFWGVPHR